MESFPREDVRAAFARIGVTNVRRASPVDPGEEVFLLSADEFARIDAQSASVEVMGVLPHTKVWVVEDGPEWQGEPVWLSAPYRRLRDRYLARRWAVS